MMKLFMLAFALSTAGASLAFAANDTRPAPHTYHHPHRAYHRLPAVREATPSPAPAAAARSAPQAAPFGLAWPHIAPYPNGKGDEDGLSEDPNDCNKGCIDGNTPD
jgi:hypothetical protein